MPTLSLRAWLVVLAVVTALPLLASLAYAFRLQQQQQELARVNLLRERATLVATQIDGRFGLAAGLLRLVAGSREIADGDLDELLLDLGKLLEAQELIEHVTLLAADQRIVLRATRSGDGVVRAPARPSCGQPAPGAASTAPAKRRLTSVADPAGATGAASWKALMSAAVEAGPLAGCTIQVAIPMRFFSRLLGATLWPDGWVAAVIDAEHRIVARSVHADQFVGSFTTAPLRAAIAAGGDRVFDGVAKEGNPVVAYTASVRRFDGWHVAVGVPASIVDAETRASARTLLAISGAAVAFACGMALLLAGLVSREVRAIGEFGAGTAPAVPRQAAVQEIGVAASLLAQSQDRLRLLADRQRAIIDELERENARRVASEERLAAMHVNLLHAQEDERRRIARELHDELGQELAMLHILQKSMASAAGAPERLATMQQACDDALRHLIERVRNLALDLRPSHLDDLGLAAALEELLRRTAVPSGLVVSSHLDSGPSRLPPHIETALYRVAQAAVTNVLRHAQAHHLQVGLDVVPGRATLVVEDDGRGFDPEAAREASGQGRHMGLLVMQERVRALGGTIRFSSGGAGTRIEAEIPLDGDGTEPT